MAHAERPVGIKLQDSDRSKNIICLFPWELVEQKEMLNAILVLLKTKNNTGNMDQLNQDQAPEEKLPSDKLRNFELKSQRNQWKGNAVQPANFIQWTC